MCFYDISITIQTQALTDPDTIFTYSDNKLEGAYDANGKLVQEWFWLDDMPVAMVQKNSVIYTITTDHLNTPRQLQDATGKVVWSWNSANFGNLKPNEDPDGDGNQVTFNLRFPGQYYDAETGLHYNYFRDYNPATGRYVQSDPIGLQGGINTYAYVKGNPVNYKDSLGLFVFGVYDNSSGSLYVYDRDSGRSMQIGAESGGKPFGDAISNGSYDILQHPDPDFYRLEPIDSKYGDDTNDRNGRTNFRLHRPGLTVGCIAAKEEKPWKGLRDLIRNTSSDTASVLSKSRLPWSPETEDLIRYGRIDVVNSR